jgi:hypothetical protein
MADFSSFFYVFLVFQIKTAAADQRSETEQQIREDVLEEVKASLLDSLPKK